MSKLISMLRAKLEAKSAQLEDLANKAAEDTATDVEVKAYEDALNETEELLKKIDREEKAQEIRGRASKPADKPKGSDDEDGETKQVATVPARPKVEDKAQYLSFAAAAVIAGKEHGQHPLKMLEDDGYGQIATQLKAVNTLVSSEGGILVPNVISGGIMDLLRVESTFIQANPNRVTLTNGKFTLPRGLAGATASYIAQGALKPVSTPTFDTVAMAAKKLAGIVPMTNEARKWTIGDIEAYVRNDLRSAMALTMDLNAWLGTGAGASPTGILNKSGVQTVTGSFSSATAPTLAELDTFANAMILKLTSAKLYANPRWTWVMSYRTALKLASMRVGSSDGDIAFPELAPLNGGGRWKGFPVVITSQIPTTGGGTTDETTIALVDFQHVLFGEEAGIRMAMSDQATLDVNGAGSLVHLWQQNMFAILAESEHDFGLRTVLAVVKATIRF